MWVTQTFVCSMKCLLPVRYRQDPRSNPGWLDPPRSPTRIDPSRNPDDLGEADSARDPSGSDSEPDRADVRSFRCCETVADHRMSEAPMEAGDVVVVGVRLSEDL